MPITRRHPYNTSMAPIARKIQQSEERRGMSPEEAKRVAYATLNRMGAKQGSVTTRKGAAMMEEHRRGVRGKLRQYTRHVECLARRRFGHVPRRAIRLKYPSRSETLRHGRR